MTDGTRTPGPPEPDDTDLDDDLYPSFEDSGLLEPPHPINWNLLTANEAETEWLELNAWINWLRRTYGLPA